MTVDDIDRSRIEELIEKRELEYDGEEAYSNLDNTYGIDEDEMKRTGRVYAHHAWDYCGYVWYDRKTERFYEEVWQYKRPIALVTGDTLDDVISETIREFGGE